MTQYFPELAYMPDDNVVITDEFDVKKRQPIHNWFVGYNQNVFKFRSNDRFIPSRRDVTAEFLKKTPSKVFDVSSPDFCMKTMKKIEYQNHLRQMFLEGQHQRVEKKGSSKEGDKQIKLVHTDWMCKVPDMRLKFLPDFETLKKPGFGLINNYIWSSKQIIAATSRHKVCLYHPFNGFTRTLDVNAPCCITFSNSGEYLAMAYRKSSCEANDSDLFVFRIDDCTLFDSENLDTEKIRTSTPHDVTALCYTRNDDFLICGTNVGSIIVLQCIASTQVKSSSPTPHKWNFVKTLTSAFHKHKIRKISFSAKFRYMASLDTNGQLVIWNGGSWTVLFSIQEHARHYKHLQWHPFVEDELIYGKSKCPALYLVNVVQKRVVACHMNWNDDMEITSIAFNPITAQLAVCFYIREEYINRVSILASMSQVISTFDFNYIYGGLKLFWNPTGTMLGAGAQYFRFAFWSFHKNRTFPDQMIKGSASKNPVVTLSDSKFSSLR